MTSGVVRFQRHRQEHVLGGWGEDNDAPPHRVDLDHRLFCLLPPWSLFAQRLSPREPNVEDRLARTQAWCFYFSSVTELNMEHLLKSEFQISNALFF